MPHDRSIAKLARRATATGGLSSWRRRAAGRLVEHAAAGDSAAAVALAQVLSSPDRQVAGIAYDGLLRCTAEAVIDAVCVEWGEHNDRGLVDLLERSSDPARVERWVLGALRTGHVELLRYAAEQVAETLVALAFENGDEAALKAALAIGHEPADPVRRAVFLFLAGDFERYAGLDFDGGLLSAAHAGLHERIRLRLAAMARMSGRIDWLHKAIRSPSPTTLDDAEWMVLFDLLVAAERWDELWELALEIPPMWSARILRELGKRHWSPESGTARGDWAFLVGLAEACPDVVPLGSQLVPGERFRSPHLSEQLGAEPDPFVTSASGLLLPSPKRHSQVTMNEWLVSSGFEHVRRWRSTLQEAAETPVARLRPAEIDQLRIPDGGRPAERAWIDLMSALVSWRHRHDIEVSGGTGPGEADIELDREQP